MSQLEYYEIEFRPVIVDRQREVAWAWTGKQWRDAPGLVGKSMAEGKRMDREAFLTEFPEAPVSEIEIPLQQ